MIKTLHGTTAVQGSENEIMADLSVIISSLHKHLSEEIGADDSKERIMQAVERGFYTEEELEKAILEESKVVAELLGNLFGELKELLEGRI